MWEGLAVNYRGPIALFLPMRKLSYILFVSLESSGSQPVDCDPWGNLRPLESTAALCLITSDFPGIKTSSQELKLNSFEALTPNPKQDLSTSAPWKGPRIRFLLSFH